ncbi:MAG: pseudouridine synthase, partial [Henriciella sp.]
MTTDVPAVDYNPDPGMKIETVFSDNDLLIANKPSGLLSVPGRGAEKSVCLTSLLETDHGAVRAVHRLDMDTSGLIVLARNDSVHRALSRAFERRQVEKQYEAVVLGEPESVCGLIDLP